MQGMQLLVLQGFEYDSKIELPQYENVNVRIRSYHKIRYKYALESRLVLVLKLYWFKKPVLETTGDY